MSVRVEVSARHLHLSKEDCLTLFDSYELPVRNRLSQKGEFASEYTVEVVGPKNRLKKVRVLGPLRQKSQLEISSTDAFFLGIDAPLANSGEGKGCAIRVIGAKGEFVSDIAMIAKRHLHLSPNFAKQHKIKNGDLLRVHVAGDRALLFENVTARVSEKFSDSLHIDTDEANAAGVNGMAYGQLIKK